MINPSFTGNLLIDFAANSADPDEMPNWPSFSPCESGQSQHLDDLLSR